MEGPEEMAGMGDIKQFVIVTGMSGAGHIYYVYTGFLQYS